MLSTGVAIKNYRHLCMASPTACFYFSSFEVPLIIYDPLRDSKDFPSIEVSTCKLNSVPSNRLLLLMYSVEPTSWTQTADFYLWWTSPREIKLHNATNWRPFSFLVINKDLSLFYIQNEVVTLRSKSLEPWKVLLSCLLLVNYFSVSLSQPP